MVKVRGIRLQTYLSKGTPGVVGQGEVRAS